MGSCRCVRFSRRGGPVIPVLDGLGNGRCGRAECPACSACYEFRIQVDVDPKIRAPAERAGPRWLHRTGQAQWPAVARPLGHVCRSSLPGFSEPIGPVQSVQFGIHPVEKTLDSTRSLGPGCSSRRLSRCCICVSRGEAAAECRRLAAQLVLMAMRLTLWAACSVLGRVTVRTPLRKLASALSS